MFDQNQLHNVETSMPSGSKPPVGPRPTPPTPSVAARVPYNPAQGSGPLPSGAARPIPQPTAARAANLSAVVPGPSIPGPDSAPLSVENADIYYMPENFQKNNQVAGKTTSIRGIWVLITVIALLIILGGGVYAFWLQPDFLNKLLGRNAPAAQTPVVSIPSEPQTPLPAASTRPEGSPKETYLVFRSELALADSVESYLAAYAKYATAARSAALTDKKNSLAATTASSAELFSALRGDPLPVLDGTEDITEDISDQRAVLTIAKSNKRQVGTVVFLAEKGQWKLSEELWQDTAQTGTVNQNPTQATDDDQDGLSNVEETALGTDLKKADSDGDGYSDLEELNNGYNPTGPGKLAADSKLTTYLNTTFSLSFLYPSAWDKSVASTDDSIILTAPDRQFIQVLIQPNAEREDIASWYKKTFSVETIPAAQLLSNTNWDGVKTPDGQTAYLTNKDKSYIFVLTYNLGSSSVLNYKNIFEMVLRSFTLAS